MADTRAAIRQRLRQFDFRNLFVEELGWDRYHFTQEATVDGQSFRLIGVAEKHGMAVYECQSTDGLADYPTRRKVERTTGLAHEKLIVFTDAGRTEQVWQWVKREPNRPAAYREFAFRSGQKEELLVQKLNAIAFDIEEAERLSSVAEVAGRVSESFDVEKVTKRFYDRFKTEHQAFLGFVKGIEKVADRDWYASLMLNRLMFIYFFQRRGFLDNDSNYLRNRMRTVQRIRGSGQFLSFYRYFLRRLFHEGLGKPESERDAELDSLLGHVPYLNGGLFDEHQLEHDYPTIDIADDAFLRVFDFFDSYDWHLDERPIGSDREINPDILGYIFEKYINQKQMGAYYTKEDITGYIAQSALVPFLLESAERKCAIAFRRDGHVWRLLQEDPGRYVYGAMLYGVDKPLPSAVARGQTHVSKRTEWNKPVADGYALPTETWREHIARRHRCDELRKKLSGGEVHSVNDLVTLNIDLRRFAQDAIENAEGPELVRAFWQTLAGRIPERSNENWEQGITVLDPACGSGAFLFAALNVLLPLYEACLQRMQRFIDEADLADPERSGSRYPDFRRILARVQQHASPRYFVLKSIVLENLYGVDIMEEAVEICKLRLFLKLVAQLDSPEQIEPLPDIDFNVRPGNSLVGFVTRDQVRNALNRTPTGQFRIDARIEHEPLQRIDDLADTTDRAFKEFRRQQMIVGGKVTAADKSKLRDRLTELQAELDGLLARQYGTRSSAKGEYQNWRSSYQPFHWLVEFYGIMANGGFDIVLGNPPYVEYSKVQRTYRVTGYATQTCGNLYAMFIERSYELMGESSRFGFIVQAPIVSTTRMAPVRNLLANGSNFLAYSSYDDRPSKLFDGLEHCRVAIVLSRRSHHGPPLTIQTTRYHKWYSEERQNLFECIQYLPLDNEYAKTFIPKFRSQLELSILCKILACRSNVGQMFSKRSTRFRIYYKITGVGHWFTFTKEPPKFWRNGVEESSTRENSVTFESRLLRDTAFSVLSSTTHYWLYQARTNCRDLNPSDVAYLPVPDAVARGNKELSDLSEQIANVLEETSTTGRGTYAVGGSVAYQRFHPKVAKPFVDEVDRELGRYYGFTPDELDFIINYDIKYRLGAGAEAGEE